MSAAVPSEDSASHLPGTNDEASTPAGPTRDWLRLLRQMIKSTRRLRRIVGDVGASFAVTDTELLCLFCCLEASGDGVTQIALADDVGVSAAQMSSIVEHLKQRELLVGRRGRRDRRRIHWRLTASGRALLGQMTTVLNRTFRQWDQDVPPEGVARLVACLRLLNQLEDDDKIPRCVVKARGDDGRGEEKGDAA